MPITILNSHRQAVFSRHLTLAMALSMPRFVPATYLIFLALLFWLMAGWAGTRGHFCFDGKGPPISVHMEVTGGGHTDHSFADSHLDVDVNLLQMMKSEQSWLWVLIAAVALFVCWIRPVGVAPPRDPGIVARIPIYLIPPLRAPPISVVTAVSQQ